jgi:inhibitor of the pro-sigma K processing machinery
LFPAAAVPIRRFTIENFTAILIPVLLCTVLLRLISLPIRWGWKFFLNSTCGFLCLWLLNSISGFTGIFFPVNYVTVAIAGFLGLPGIGLLALVQLFL